MDRLKKLRADVVGVLGVTATAPVGRPVVALLDEFCAEYESMEVIACSLGSKEQRWTTIGVGESGRMAGEFDTTIFVSRKPAPAPRVLTVFERLMVLEDELRERCGNLGRRVCSLEFHAGGRVGGESVRDELLDAAEGLEAAVTEMGKEGRDSFLESWQALYAARHILSLAISKERSR